MTLTIDLTPEEEERLRAQAQAHGVDVNTLLRELIAGLETPPKPKRTLVGYGKLAHITRTVEDFHRDRQGDRHRENLEFGV
jgi:hypothetical protein